MAAIRKEVDYRFDALNWNFLRLMAEIAAHAAEPIKYGAAHQYTESRLEDNRSPVNHIASHLHKYIVDVPHDHFGTREHQLAAIAYNAMMEYYYLIDGGATVCDALYRPVGTYKFVDGKAVDATVPWDEEDKAYAAEVATKAGEVIDSVLSQESAWGRLVGGLFPNGKK